MTSLFDLSGQVALVTGAAGGLGRQIAITLAALGADLVITDLDAPACTPVADEIAQLGRQSLTLAADLGSHDSVSALSKAALDWRGRLDALVCCAGMEGHVGSLLDVADRDWQALMTVNLQSALWLCSALSPQLRRQRTGSIVLISSIAGFRGNKAIGLYGIAKAGLSQLARNLAVELGPDGIRVNAVAPGLIETPLSHKLMEDESFMRRRLLMTPLRRVGQPEEIAGVVAMLTSRAGGFITGQTLVVDGGTLITDGN